MALIKVIVFSAPSSLFCRDQPLVMFYLFQIVHTYKYKVYNKKDSEKHTEEKVKKGKKQVHIIGIQTNFNLLK